MPTVKTSCKVTKWEEDRSSKETPRITPAKCETACLEIKGEISSSMNMIYTPDGNTVFPFVEHVKAEDFNGKKGSFMTMGTGSYNGKTSYLSADFQIIEGTGTDELEGITGKGIFNTSKDNPHDVEYVFEIGQ